MIGRPLEEIGPGAIPDPIFVAVPPSVGAHHCVDGRKRDAGLGNMYPGRRNTLAHDWIVFRNQAAT